MQHPEIPSELNELIDFVESQGIVDVWCCGCQMYRQMNEVYSKYIPDNQIKQCRFCRDTET